MIHVPAELTAAIEAAFTSRCDGGGCDQPAAWTLPAPCGHDNHFCNGCAPLIDAALCRAAADAPAHVCHSTGTASPWSDFRWVPLP